MKFVVRLLDAAGVLLGWQEIVAVPLDGQIWTPQFVIPVDVDGRTARLSFHWCDLNIEASRAVQETDVQAGSEYLLPEMVAMIVGEPAKGLPPVTTHRSVVIGVPTGTLGAKGL